MQIVKQEDDWGCGIAVVAMLTGNTYEFTKEYFTLLKPDHDWNKHGLYVTDLERYFTERGWWHRTLYSGWDLKTWPPRPFADMHWCIVRQPSGNSHFVAMDHAGLVFDPLTGRSDCKLSDWEKVDQVNGLAYIGEL